MNAERPQSPPRFWIRHVVLAAAAVGAAVLALISYGTGALNALERPSIDTRFAIRGRQAPGHGIVIIGIDHQTLDALDVRPPIPRHYYARLLDVLHAAHPRLIAVDAQFIGKTDPSDDRALVSAVARDGPVLLGTEGAPGAPTPVPAGVRHARGAVLGVTQVSTDPDGILRRMIYADYQPSLAVMAADLLRGHPVSPSHFPGDLAWVDYAGPPNTFPHYSFIRVLDGQVPASTFTGKTVWIGTTDPVGKDIFQTSASSIPMPGVEFQANALNTILNGYPLQSAGGGLVILLLLMFAFLPPLLSLRLSGLVVLGCSVIALFVFLVACQLAFDSGTIINVPDPILALALGTIGAIAAESFVQRRQLQYHQAMLDLLPGPSDFFISYRRSQSELAANTLREGLERKVGANRVFMDTDAIDPGEQWPTRLQEALAHARAMLVVIGPQWTSATATDGSRRLDNPEDWVRREVAAGLASEEIVVVPVLHDGAPEPAEDVLPDDLKSLSRCQVVRLSGRDVEEWIGQLYDRIQRGRARHLSAVSGESVATG